MTCASAPSRQNDPVAYQELLRLDEQYDAVARGWEIYGVLDTARIDGKTVWWLFDCLSSGRGTPAHCFDTHTEALKYAADRPLNDIWI